MSAATTTGSLLGEVRWVLLDHPTIAAAVAAGHLTLTTAAPSHVQLCAPGGRRLDIERLTPGSARQPQYTLRCCQQKSHSWIPVGGVTWVTATELPAAICHWVTGVIGD